MYGEPTKREIGMCGATGDGTGEMMFVVWVGG